jgi:uncharacterized protein
MISAAFVITGFLVGILVGLTGMGGGSLMTPILVLILGIRPTLAVGTDLAYASLTKAAGAIQHFRQGNVRISTGLWLSLGSVPASLVGVGAIRALRIALGLNIEQIVSQAVGIMLFVVAGLLMLQPFLSRWVWPRDKPDIFQPRLITMRRHRTPLLVLTGAVVGLVVGLTSVGGGSLMMFALLLLYPKWPMRQRVGTDVFQGCLLSTAAASAHWAIGDVSPSIMLQLLIGSLPGVLIGTRLTRVTPEGAMRPVVAGVLAFSAWRLL